MAFFKKTFTLLIALCLLLSLAPVALASELQPGDERFEGKSWDEVVEQFLSDRGTDRRYVGIGYRNTVTGEEHFINGDEYRDAGSLYKVPMNMYFTEKISKGEMSWDSYVAGTEYKNLLEWTIVNSNNTFAEYMWNHMGGYHQYRKLICPYMGVDAETVEDKFYENNFFTPRQMLYCLNLLYTESERFPGVIDAMLRAEPENYFNYKPQQFDVAHKYGYNSEGWQLFLNDSAIVYTDDPIVIVMFTDTVSDPYDALSDFCTLMCDYTQYHTALRLEQEAQEALQAAQEADRQAAEEAVRREEENSTVETDATGRKGVGNIKSLIIALALAVVVVIAAITFISKVAASAQEDKINGFWGSIAVLFAAAALLLSIVGMTFGTLVAKPDGDPAETVNAFLEALDRGSYNEAYTYLSDYSSLGLENQAQGDIGALVQQAVRDSFSYSLKGECKVDGLSATQQAELRYLDLKSFSSELELLTNQNLEAIVAERPRSEIYDENNNYLPSVTDEAYRLALENILSRAEEYCACVDVELELSYHAGHWQLKTNPQLLNALIGGCY